MERNHLHAGVQAGFVDNWEQNRNTGRKKTSGNPGFTLSTK